MKRGFLDLLCSNDPEFFWHVISGPPCITKKTNLEDKLDPKMILGSKYYLILQNSQKE
jgi:hypothetical protein